ncbi:MAG: glycosyltransferase family 2 protein [Victivallaceae bacterium]|nr:glycosyltransferase family 2 protein [Victivallaceae bacterium]
MEADNQHILSVVMPVYNEKDTVTKIVDQVLARPEVGELVIVDDGSTDGSGEVLDTLAHRERVRVFHQDGNQGKGAAVIRGISEATMPYVIIQDADFEYDPDDYPKVIAPLIQGQAEAVYGLRFMATPGQVRNFRHEMGNKFLTFMSNLFSDIHLSDMETCYKAFRREIVQNLNLESKRFGIEVEFTAKLAKGKALRIWEVPIRYNPRRYAQGKKITWRDGLAALRHIIHFNCFVPAAKCVKRPWSELIRQDEA